MKHNLLKSLIISVILLMGVSNAWANVVGVIGKDLDQYTVKLNVCKKDGTREQPTMRKTTMTYNGQTLYQTSFSYSNSSNTITCMQIQRWNGNKHNGERVLYTSETHHDNFYGYVFDYDDGTRFDHVASFKKDARLYFDAMGWNETDIKLCIGHGFWQTYYQMNKIDNTNLYYGNPVDGWGDAIGICVVGNTTAAENGQGFIIDVATKAQECTGLIGWSLNAVNDNNAYLMVNKGKSGEQPEMSYYESHYETQNGLNSIQTIKYSISENGATYSTLNSGTTPAKISVSSYKFTDRIYNQVSPETKTLHEGSSTYSQQFIAARTATTTLTVDWESLDPNYKFDGWYDEKGNQLETNLTYTYYPTEENTIYARFSESPSLAVYLKNNTIWNKPGDRFAIYYRGNMQYVEEMQQIGCSEYYQYEIPGKCANYEVLVFKKIKSDADIFDSRDDIDDQAGETADLKIPAADNSNKLYDISKVYLKPNDTWKNDGARFAAYFWVSGSSPVQKKWMSMSPSPENDGTYYCDYPTDHTYDNVKFCRMNPANTDNNFNQGNCWNSTINLSLHNNKKGYGNLFEITNIDDGQWKNKWTTYTATRNVTLVADSHGTYRVTCSNGTSQTSALNEDRTLSVPLNSTITIETVQPQPGYAHTHGARIKIGTNEETTATLGTEYTICGETTIKGNFVTANPTKIYLKPNMWNTNNPTYVAHVWHDGGVKDYTMIGIGDAPYAYYSCTIDPGYHSIVFYRKSTNGQTIWNKTKDLFIPVDDDILYSITSMGEGEFNPAEGNWGPLPTCTITAGYPDIGSYGIKYKDQVHYATSNPRHSANFTVPFGAEVEVVESNPGDEAYTSTIGMLTSDNKNVERAFTFASENSNVVTITRDTKFDDLYATKDDEHVVFLAIPQNDNRFNKWLDCSDGNHKQGHDIILWQSINTYHYPEEHTYKLHEKERTIETDNFIYYQFTLEQNVYRFNFQYKSKNNTTDTGFDGVDAHAGSTTEHCPPISTKNCFYLNGEIDGDNHAGGYKGYWDYGPPCKVIMTFTNIGRYGFKDCFGNVHYRSPNSKETEFSVPWGSQVEVLEGEPGNDTFTGTVGMLSEDNTTIEKRFHDGENEDNFVTITRNTTFDDLFATKEEHVVYLGIPNEGFDDWYINNSDKMFAWIKEPYNDLGLREIQPTFVIDDITYYQYTLPAGIFEFAFQRKTGNNIDDPICETRLFTFELPVTDYNCFILEGEGVRNHKDKNYLTYDGYWTKLPAKPENVGDYRVLYAEKELIKTHEEGETEDWETAFRTVYEHPSDIIPKGEASKTISLHITTTRERDGKTVHPMVILQQFQQMEGSNTYKWVNLQAHTVLPLKATGNMGMLPGRKKTFGDLPFYDDGIEAIKNDTKYEYRTDDKGNSYKGSGVWNFTVTQGVSQSGTGTTVTLNVGNTTRYRGKYYIRTEALTNGWNNYKENLMTYSDYADYNSGFSHYFCKWLLVGNNVKFTIANDHAQSISDPLYGDATDLWGKPIEKGKQMVERDQVLNEDANVRFAWYEMNNFVHRAYLGGSTHVQDRFLVVKGEDDKIFSHYVGEGLPEQGADLPAGGDGSPRYGLNEDEEIFRDDANWIYHADIQIKPGCIANVTAQHFGKTQTFIKNRTLVYGEDLDDMKNKYPIRLLYDFKINRLITGYIPNGDNETKIEPFTTNLMLIRKHHEQATQLLFNSNAKTTQGAYGVMTFERDFLRDNNNKTNKERAAYFISFPFDVKISDVFGFGQFYKHWFIQYYDGAARAKNGLWADTDTYWKHITDPNTVLKAYQGYALLFSLSNIEKSGVLDASKEISLYFPSTNNNIGNITDANPEVTVDVPAHICTIEREYRKFKDSNWNLIGVPAYADVSGFENNKIKDPYNNEVYFYWKRDVAEDTYEVWDAKKGSSLTFQTMHAYMLQYAGVINWKAHTMSEHDYSNKLIARRNTEQEASHTLRITLNQADKKLDQTYVRLQEEDATADFDMNKDQYKIKKAKANIYSLIQNAVGQIEAGANVLPLQTTVVPLGVIIKTAGEYTFAMPDGTDGIVVELIDYQTNTRTNLLLDNYTVTLPAGTNNSRFALSLQPDKTVTSVDNIGNEATGDKVKKYLIDGVLYMQKDGALYDAQGRCVQ